MQYNKEQCCCFRSDGMPASACANCLKRKLNTFDYLAHLPELGEEENYVEVQFKHTRKGYFFNPTCIPLAKGDLVTVEATMGYDVGEVTLTGQLVARQMIKNRCPHTKEEPLRVLHLATEEELAKMAEVKECENAVMIKSREIARSLGLDMKIGDVEYQADGQKAIFYYIADGRVDFRQLIKDLARTFRIRVEMKQIGVRQEAGRIGGIGPCGRHLCCATWMTNFVSVGTNAARMQDFSMNPQKLAGQCGKLKCCINYEVDAYFEARQNLPDREVKLQTESGEYRQFKADILSGELSYTLVERTKGTPMEVISISAERAYHIIAQNRRGDKPFSLLHDTEKHAEVFYKNEQKGKDILSDSSLTRFDDAEGQQRNKRRNHRKKKPTIAQKEQSTIPQGQGRGKGGANNRRKGAHKRGTQGGTQGGTPAQKES